jgi:hypothetical protein
MRERLVEELDLLRQLFPDVQHGNDWVLVPAYRLPPERFNLDITPVLFSIPVGYPNTGPDNFFVSVSLRLKDGALALGFNPNPNSSTGPAPIPGDWGWFSWHPSSWRPMAKPELGDNFVTFLRGVGMCLRGEESG